MYGCVCSRLRQVLVTDVKVLPVLLKNLIDPEYLFSDQICTILSNLTRHEKTCKTVFKVGPSSRSGKFYLGWEEVAFRYLPTSAGKYLKEREIHKYLVLH